MIKWRFELKWVDAWIGVFFRLKRGVLHIWICIIPFFPLHLEIKTKAPIKEPTIVCLCGSVRFLHVFQEVAFQEALVGHIVLTVECEVEDGTVRDLSPDLRLHFDELHRRKIAIADEVFVLNIGGYVGSHTRSEIEYARRLGKPIRWLVPESENRHE
jgi:hypothetical protein